jgi:predicted nucleic acid-binding protein
VQQRRRQLAPHPLASTADDALVGYAAKVHGLVLATRDERARDTCHGLNVEFEFFG